MIRFKSSLFDSLKSHKSFRNSKESEEEPFFQLRFEKNVPKLFIIDETGNNYRPPADYFGGYTKKILRAISSLEERSQHRVDWGDRKSGIDLSENDFLMLYLSHSPRFVDETLTCIRFIDKPAQLVLTIEGQSQLQCRVWLVNHDQRSTDFNFISDGYVLLDNRLMIIPSIGENFGIIDAFNTLILTSELGGYLSLLYSYFENIPVEFNDYKTVYSPPLQANSAIIFEKVDPANSLHLRISQIIPGFDPDFIENYDLSKVAQVKDLEREIHIRDIDYQNQSRNIKKINRLLNRHKKILDDKNAGYYFDDNRYIIDESLAVAIVQEDLPKLISEYAIFGAERLKRYKVKTVQPELTFNVAHGIDFLEGSAELSIEGERFSLFDALYQFRQNAYVQLSDGTRAIINPDYVDKLERIFLKKKETVAVSIFDLPLIDDLVASKVSGGAYTKAKGFFKGLNELDREGGIDTPVLKENLRGYQQTGYRWLKYLYQNAMGGCLADDMGLGKTIQAIALLSSIYPQELNPSLIIVPKSLIFNWEQEILKFNPDLTYYIYYGQQRDLQQALNHQLIITSYGTVRNEIERLSEEMFCYVILDESQQIKNLNSQISKAVVLLQSKNRLALSGTPIENNLGELYALFRFLNPAILGGIERFSRNYLFPIQQAGDIKLANELKKKIEPFMLRRLKVDVLKDLPEKIEQKLFVELSDEHRRFYEQRRSFFHDTVFEQIHQEGLQNTQFFVLQAITELRQIASIPESKSEAQIVSPKREVLLSSVQDAVANGHKILIFANFLSVLDFVAEDLETNGIVFETMTGATRNRQEIVNKFQTDSRINVFLMTLKTGGHGLNLTAADTVFIFDPWWNVAAEDQAIDRTHRIGQDRTVFSYKLISKGTIEEKIITLQERKKRLFDDFITPGESITRNLNESDISYIFSSD